MRSASGASSSTAPRIVLLVPHPGPRQRARVEERQVVCGPAGPLRSARLSRLSAAGNRCYYHCAQTAESRPKPGGGHLPPLLKCLNKQQLARTCLCISATSLSLCVSVAELCVSAAFSDKAFSKKKLVIVVRGGRQSKCAASGVWRVACAVADEPCKWRAWRGACAASGERRARRAERVSGWRRAA
jgi:hypothetical protein